ncbi:hypothetical protein [Streptomyces sp. NBC_01618]|uniref:hypothetical protein n=1 Tax=Streptomyces sp. NBC_01618 TaxID=2975900 RepID=UPI003864B60A|nr:hypothetical protein OH735_32055 [Streptomyces sp. NBC_01618]
MDGVGGDLDALIRAPEPQALPREKVSWENVRADDLDVNITSDGHVHPAPCTPTEHLWWGDGGGDRAGEAAAVVDQLPDDLGATVDLHQHWRAPKGLTALFNEEHKKGAELTRAGCSTLV